MWAPYSAPYLEITVSDNAGLLFLITYADGISKRHFLDGKTKDILAITQKLSFCLISHWKRIQFQIQN